MRLYNQASEKDLGGGLPLSWEDDSSF